MNRKILQKASLTLFTFSMVLTSMKSYSGELKNSEYDLKSIQSNHQVEEVIIGQSSLGRNISGIRIGDVNKPAILVVGNMGGELLLPAEAVVEMAARIAKKDDLQYAWYFFQNPNPDAYANYLESNGQHFGNGQAVDLDRDGTTGEDPCDDLNSDGLISMMRWKDPEGVWVADKKDDRLMIKAKPSKGNFGEYKMVTEGIDNDRDGLYNEDSEDGISVNRNFSAQFDYFKYQNGLYPGSSPEAYAWMKFVCEHPEIAMVISLDKTETLDKFAEPEDKKIANLKKIKPTRRMIYMFDLDKKSTYSIDQLLEKANEGSSQQITQADLYEHIEKNPVESIYRTDRVFYKLLSKEYNKMKRTEDIDQKRLSAETIQNGSFEKWLYLHRGIPVLAKCLYRPAVVSKTDSLSSQLQKIAIADSLNGFVEWTSYNHPTLGDVEIGGYNEQLFWQTSDDVSSKTISKQLDWLCNAVEYLPSIDIISSTSTTIGSDLYKLEVVVKNSGKMSYPLDMGVLNNKKQALIVEIGSDKLSILEGKQRTKITQLSSGEQRKLTWIVQGKQNVDVTVSAASVHSTSSKIIID